MAQALPYCCKFVRTKAAPLEAGLALQAGSTRAPTPCVIVSVASG
jgi:hypothetical protein